MLDERNFTSAEKLKNGLQVTVRTIRPDDKGMLAVFNRSGFPIKQEHADGFVHVVLSLAGSRS